MLEPKKILFEIFLDVIWQGFHKAPALLCKVYQEHLPLPANDEEYSPDPPTRMVA